MFQELTLVGHLGSDPEMRYLPNGTAVTNFSLATNNNYTDKNGEAVSETTWFRVAAWGRIAETANQYLSKGSRVLVKGMLTPDKQTGSPRTFSRHDGSVGASYEVKAHSILFLTTMNHAGDPEQGNEEAFENFDLD